MACVLEFRVSSPRLEHRSFDLYRTVPWIYKRVPVNRRTRRIYFFKILFATSHHFTIIILAPGSSRLSIRLTFLASPHHRKVFVTDKLTIVIMVPRLWLCFQHFLFATVAIMWLHNYCTDKHYSNKEMQ